MAVQMKRLLSILFKSQTYFGQFQVCVWLVSCLTLVLGTEIVNSTSNSLSCNNTSLPSPRIVCPDSRDRQMRLQKLFTRVYAIGSFVLWTVYTFYILPKLWVLSRDGRSKSLCSLFGAYFLQLLLKVLFNIVMLFTFIFHVHYQIPTRFECVLKEENGSVSNVSAIVICAETNRVAKSAVQTALLLTLAVLALFALLELVYISRLIRLRSKTIFTEQVRQLELVDNLLWCLCLMPSDRQFALLHLKLRGPNESNDPLKKYLEEIKGSLLKKTEYMSYAFLGRNEAPKLDDMFVQPEVQGAKSSTLNITRISQNSKSTKRVDEKSLKSVNIIITGDAGVGKTTLARDVIRKWAQHSSRLQFEVVLLLDLNVYEFLPLSIHDLLSAHLCTEISDTLVKHLLYNPEKILIVVDNIHPSDLDCKEENFRDTLEEVMPVFALYKKLVTGKLIRGATILTFSRPVQSCFPNSLAFDSHIEILGFSLQAVKNYIKRFFTMESPHSEELDVFIETLPDSILSLCSVPLNCFCLCCYLKWICDSHCLSLHEAQPQLPETITQFYINVLQMIVDIRRSVLPRKAHSSPCFNVGGPSADLQGCEELPSRNGLMSPSHDNLSDVLRGKQPWPPSSTKRSCGSLGYFRDDVCFLAKKGMDEKRAIYRDRELRDSLPDAVIFTYFTPISSQNDCDGVQYTFPYPYLQELQAAYFFATQPVQELELFFKEVKGDDTCRLDLVLQLICGLLSLPIPIFRKKCKKIVSILQEMGLESQSCKRKQKDLQLLIIKCVAEIGNSTLSREIASQMIPTVEFLSCGVGILECTALTSVLKEAPFASIKRLDLSGNKIGAIGIRHIARRLLQTSKGPTQELNVQANSIGDLGIKELAPAVKKKSLRATVLNLAHNCITSAGVFTLVKALDSNIFLEELDLSSNKICNQGVEHLGTVLRMERCTISRLNLSRNDIDDEGVGAMEAVQLKTINLAWNNIRYEGVKSLVSILPTLRRLVELDLSGAVVEDVGMQIFLPFLVGPKCKLEILCLNHCSLKDEGVTLCVKAITSSHNLINKLSIAGNGITNTGVLMLARALCITHNKLTSLNLSSNFIKDEGVRTISESLGSPNCKLQELDLSLNCIQNNGCKCLATALRKRNCLKKLDLQGNEVGDEGAAYLLTAPRVQNCKLQELLLDGNEISDQGISGLPHVFRSPHCKLGRLGLGMNSISRNSLSETLNEVLKSPFCQLEQLS